MIEGSGTILLTNGSGSGSRRPKNMLIRWIRIRIWIRNTAWRSAMSSTDVTRPDTVCFSARRTTPPPPRDVTKFRVCS